MHLLAYVAAAVGLAGCSSAADENAAPSTRRATTPVRIPTSLDMYSSRNSIVHDGNGVMVRMNDVDTPFSVPSDAAGVADIATDEGYREKKFAELTEFMTKTIQSLNNNKVVISQSGLPGIDHRLVASESLRPGPLESLSSELKAIGSHIGTRFSARHVLKMHRYHKVVEYAIPLVLEPNSAALLFVFWIIFATSPATLPSAVVYINSNCESESPWNVEAEPAKAQSIQAWLNEEIPHTFHARIPALIERYLTMQSDRELAIGVVAKMYALEAKSDKGFQVTYRSPPIVYKMEGILCNIVPN